jgi:hypothetical protein
MAGTGSANAKGKGKGNAKGKGKGKEKKKPKGNGQGSAGNQQHVRDGPVAPALARARKLSGSGADYWSDLRRGARGRRNFYSLKKASRAREPTAKTTSSDNNSNISKANILIPMANDLGPHLRRASGFVVVVAFRQVRSARRLRRRMGLRTMASTQPRTTTDPQPSGTRRRRARRGGDRQARARVRRGPIQTFGIPTAPSSLRSRRPSFGCTSRRCRSTRRTSLPRSRRRRRRASAEGARSSRSRSTSGARTGTCPFIASPRRRRTILRDC